MVRNEWPWAGIHEPLRQAGLVLVAVMLLACASQPLGAVRPREQPTGLEQELLQDVADRTIDHRSPIEAALTVAGVQERERLTMLQDRLRETLAPLLRRVGQEQDPRKRGARLLRGLHGDITGPLLRRYQTKASTLVDVMQRGEYNCVAAATLYIIAAREVELDARPVLLPTHARVAVHIDGEAVVVEPTSPNGFDPDERVLLQQLYRLGAEPDEGSGVVRLYRDVRGEEVDFAALLGVVYINESATRTAQGEYEAAAALHKRAEAFVPDHVLPILRRMRVTTLNSLGGDLYDKKQYAQAVQVLRTALDESKTERLRALSSNNLIATAQQRIVQLRGQGDDQAASRFVEQFRSRRFIYDQLYAFLLASGAARAVDDPQDWDSVAAAVQRARAHAATDEERAQMDRTLAHARLNALQDRADAEPEQAWASYQQLELPSQEPTLVDHHRQAGLYIASTRCSALADQGRCDELTRAAEDWQALKQNAPVRQVRAHCHAVVARRLSQAKDYPKALSEQRKAVALYPEESAHRHNLLAMLQRRVDQLLSAENCAGIVPLVAEARKLGADMTFFDRASAYCRGSR